MKNTKPVFLTETNIVNHSDCTVHSVTVREETTSGFMSAKLICDRLSRTQNNYLTRDMYPLLVKLRKEKSSLAIVAAEVIELKTAKDRAIDDFINAVDTCGLGFGLDGSCAPCGLDGSITRKQIAHLRAQGDCLNSLLNENILKTVNLLGMLMKAAFSCNKGRDCTPTIHDCMLALSDALSFQTKHERTCASLKKLDKNNGSKRPSKSKVDQRE